jgi:hypothetical protein
MGASSVLSGSRFYTRDSREKGKIEMPLTRSSEKLQLPAGPVLVAKLAVRFAENYASGIPGEPFRPLIEKSKERIRSWLPMLERPGFCSSLTLV